MLESECGFLEPDSMAGKVTITKNVQVDIDTVVPGNLLSYCLPTDDPFPKLRATSNDTASLPLNYFWAYRCDTCAANEYDTIEGQEVPYHWAKQAGWYEVRVRDPLNCAGYDRIRLVYDTNPEFKLEIPANCDRFGEGPGMPDVIWAPPHADITDWEWRTSLGDRKSVV